MTTRLEDLRPSTQAPIPLATLRQLPLGGLYMYAADDFEALMRIDRFSGGLPRCSGWRRDGGGWIASNEARTGEFRYPKLPRLHVTKDLAPAIISGEKRVTRRKRAPKWAKAGELFMVVENPYRQPRGLGVFRCASVETQARSGCVHCGRVVVFDPQQAAYQCPTHGGVFVRDNLTPEELALEGFRGADPEEFWGLLKKSGNVADDGTVCRIEFKAVAA